ncbi:hypothetical protein FBB35_21895 [Nostoc sp. TCL240-02]|nr:hypothetical protein FBB35_21895 [Nostoc sp. TCL240-02]
MTISTVMLHTKSYLCSVAAMPRASVNWFMRPSCPYHGKGVMECIRCWWLMLLGRKNAREIEQRVLLLKNFSSF